VSSTPGLLDFRPDLGEYLLNSLHGDEQFSGMLQERDKLVMEVEIPCRFIYAFGHDAD